MTVSEILELCNYILDKETAGNNLPPTKFNALLAEVNLSLFNEEWQKVEAVKNQPLTFEMIAGTPLNQFLQDYLLTLVNGKASLPSDYVHYFSVNTDRLRPVEILPVGSVNARRGTAVVASASIRPFGYIAAGYLVAYPQTLEDLFLAYLRLPITPYYDYCLNASNYKTVFMPAGSVLLESANQGQMDLYTASGVTGVKILSNVLKDGVVASGTDPRYTSKTVELEWEPYMHVHFISRLLSKVGLSLGDPTVIQYAEAMKQQGV